MKLWQRRILLAANKPESALDNSHWQNGQGMRVSGLGLAHNALFASLWDFSTLLMQSSGCHERTLGIGRLQYPQRLN
jgi:hypothetical protein